MNKEAFTYLLEHPERITAAQTSQITSILEEFPYFQAARTIYLKGLKNQGSFVYNQELKRTAAHTQDRSVLFDFITSTVFNQNEISNQIKKQEEHLYNMPVSDALDLSSQVEVEELHKANTVLDPEFFIRKELSSENENEENSKNGNPEDILEVGKPLDFTDKETHSFTEWLKITSFDPIERENNEPNPKSNISDPQRKQRLKLIDKFINTNPKIKIKPPEESAKKSVIDDQGMVSETLMTETLARVYVEQKNYKKAKQAYKILSLKYPEKSGFFADQIRAIEKLNEK